MKLSHFIQRIPVVVRVLVILALVAVVWAGVSANRRAPLPKDCVSRLALVDEAITRWAKENKTDALGYPDPLAYPTEAELQGYLDDPSLLQCPNGGKYVFGSRALATTCSKHGHASFALTVPPPPSKLKAFMNTVREYLHWTPARHTGGPNSCIANLKQFDGAVEQWTRDNKKLDTDTPILSEIFGETNYIRRFPWCPNGGKYIFGTVKDPPRCTVIGHTL